MNKKLIYVIIGVVVVGALAFYGGSRFNRNQTAAVRFPGVQGTRQFDSQARMRGSGAVAGNIISKDANSITVKMQSGGSKIVLFATSTIVTKNVSATISDVSVGSDVMVNGKENQDGSLSADSIQLRLPVVNTNQ